MQKFLISLIIDTLAVLTCAYLLPGADVTGFGSAILVALSLAILNQFIKPLLVILTIPATLITFGLFLLVINALIILLADWMVLGFNVHGFWWALIFSFVLTFIKSVFNALFGNSDGGKGANSKRIS
jgi:putative membrane protein